MKLASPSAGGNIQPIFATGRSGGATSGFALYVNDFNDNSSHDLVVETNTAGATNVQSKATSPLGTFQFDGKYHAVAAVVNRTGGTLSLYYDGQLVLADAQIDTQWSTMTGDNRLGQFANADIVALNSKFDNVGIYNGLLNAADIAALSGSTGVTVSGGISLEGVANLAGISPFAPLGTFHVSLRTPGTLTEVKGFDVTLATTAGSPVGKYTLSGVTAGTYDVWIKGKKNLAVLVPNVAFAGTSGTVANVLLPAADANGDNFADTSDFGLLVGAYGTDGSIPGSGYDPKVDFNFDGFVDTTDFGLLVGNYGAAGAP